MSRALVSLLFGLACSPALADETPAEDVIDLHGTYQIWGLNQGNFMLGADHPLDDANYVVQMLRFKLKIGTPDYGVVTRMDLAQGWWGADNSPNVSTAVTTAEDGTVTGSAAYNPYKLFREKDTNYGVHVDWAYAWIDIPKIPVRVAAGRQNYRLGHRLVLDQDLDGVQVTVTPHDKVGIDLMWATMSEGYGSYKGPLGTLMSDKGDNKDADLFGGVVRLDLAPVKLGLFGVGYLDRSGVDAQATYLPQGLGYLNARFRPQVSSAAAFGLTLDSDVDVAKGLHIEAELDYLIGKDDVDNTDHAGGLLDINDGTLNGYNVYVRAEQKWAMGTTTGIAGLGFGMGSGDDDPTGGRGNINKIQTQGFFPWTNVWEDSVMPDLGGISPQGLGSPVSRGYREFENTTTLQAKLGVVPVSNVNLTTTYTWLHATQAIHGFDASGTPTNDTSANLGHEVDLNLTWNIYKKVTYKALAGVFLPGEGSGLLMLGNTDSLDPAWEVKQVVAVGF